MAGGAIAGLPGTKEAAVGNTMSNVRESFIVEGELYHVSPRSMSTNTIEFTSFPGKCSEALFSLMFWLGKLGYDVFKVEDSMEVSPMHPQFYQLTIQQKQTLEKQIKEGLAGISSAITDFELLFHDLRKYKDFIDYFSKKESAIKSKDKEEQAKAEQSLKAIFIDQVDVHTGEGVSLKHIAPRWPTIISDFMKLEDGDTNPNNIAKKYSVSEAEGVVLSTKNKLYMEWRETFEKTVKERYERLLGMVKARKFSIDEYKNMLKPYIERYKSIKEMGETFDGRKYLRKTSWLRPGAQATSMDSCTIWAFKSMTAPEHSKPTYERYEGKESITKIPFCPSFKKIINSNLSYLKENDLMELPLSSTGIEPFDKWVWALYKYIEDYYHIRFSLKELLKFRNEYIKSWGKSPEQYFKCFESDVTRVVMKTPNGTEVEDITFSPILHYFETQNMMLLRFLEIKAQEKALEKYIDEMLGDTTKGKKLNELSDEYDDMFNVYPKTKPKKSDKEKTKEEKEEEKKKEWKLDSSKSLRDLRELSQKQVMLEVSDVKKPFRLFLNTPYYSRFDDVITGPIFTDVGSGLAKIWDFLKAQFDVPGAGVAGLK